MFSWYKYLIVSLVFSRLGFWSVNLFLIAPYPDRCLLVPFYDMFSWNKYLIVNLVFSHLGFWSGNLFLMTPFLIVAYLYLFKGILIARIFFFFFFFFFGWYELLFLDVFRTVCAYSNTILYRKVHEGNDQVMVQSERYSHPRNRSRKTLN